MNDTLLPILLDAVIRGASEILRTRLADEVTAGYKDARELVTLADKRSDTAMLELFQAELPPGISLLLEESGAQGGTSSRWVGADPLDGTNHFASGGNLYSIQAHYVADGVPEIGVVFQPEVFLPLSESPNCLGRLVYATRAGGAFCERTEFTGSTFLRSAPRPVRRKPTPATKTYVACVPLSTKMTPEEAALARKVFESGIIASTTGTGGAGGNVMMCIFGGQHVYANFGAGEDLDLIPPQVIAAEAGLTVWDLHRQSPVWHVRKQPFVVAPTPEIAEKFLQAAGL